MVRCSKDGAALGDVAGVPVGGGKGGGPAVAVALAGKGPGKGPGGAGAKGTAASAAVPKKTFFAPGVHVTRTSNPYAMGELFLFRNCLMARYCPPYFS